MLLLLTERLHSAAAVDGSASVSESGEEDDSVEEDADVDENADSPPPPRKCKFQILSCPLIRQVPNKRRVSNSDVQSGVGIIVVLVNAILRSKSFSWVAEDRVAAPA